MFTLFIFEVQIQQTWIFRQLSHLDNFAAPRSYAGATAAYFSCLLFDTLTLLEILRLAYWDGEGTWDSHVHLAAGAGSSLSSLPTVWDQHPWIVMVKGLLAVWGNKDTSLFLLGNLICVSKLPLYLMGTFFACGLRIDMTTVTGIKFPSVIACTVH